MNVTLIMWTLYDRPRDYPDKVVARKFVLTNKSAHATDEVVIGDSANEVRRTLEYSGYYCLQRHPDDDSKIVEIWI